MECESGCQGRGFPRLLEEEASERSMEMQEETRAIMSDTVRRGMDSDNSGRLISDIMLMVQQNNEVYRKIPMVFPRGERK